LESRARASADDRRRRDFENRPEDDLQFFAVHGYWPEAAQDTAREEDSFVVRGLKTTIIIERV